MADYQREDRRLPFVLRVAAEPLGITEATSADDGALFYRNRALLTGLVIVTSCGADIQISDIGIAR